MRLTILLLLVSVCSFGQTLNRPAGIMWFWEYKNPNCNNCPVLIFLPGHGERSDVPNFSIIQRHGTPKLLKAKGLTYLEGFTLIVPQQTTNTHGYTRDPNNPDIIKFLKYIKANYKSQYRFLTGVSMGANGTWYGSYKGLDTLVTAIVPVSGEGDYNGGKVTHQKGIKAWGIHGSNDTAVPVSDGYRPIKGMISVGGKPKWTIIPGGTHGGNTWDVAYSLNDRPELGNTTIYKWMLSMVPEPEPEPIIPGLYLNGKFCGTDSCNVDGHLITLIK